jgi:hypothetical protein
MFRKKIDGSDINYIFNSSKVIEKIEVSNMGSLMIMLWGNFRACHKLTALDEGIFGGLTVSSINICVREKAITSEKMQKLLNVIEEYEPNIKSVREELLSLVEKTPCKKITPLGLNSILTQFPDKKFKTPELDSPEISPGIPRTDFFNDYKKNERERLEDEKVLRNMFPDLSEEEIRRYVTSETTVNEFCKTIDAHQMRKGINDYNEKYVRRTTITKPGYDVAFVEYQHTPEASPYCPGSSEDSWSIPSTSKWSIKFKTPEAINKHKHCIGLPESYSHPKNSSTLFSFSEASIEKILSILVKAGAYPETAVGQLKQENIRSFR